MRKEKEAQYKVTIRCMTYQHAEYVLEALHSFVMQETTFPFLILIVDDASTDGTAQIIRDFIKEEFAVDNPTISWNRQDDYSDNLYAQHKSNKNCFIISMNLKKNLYREQAKKRSLFEKWVDCSKYVAMCEGDDYWTDPLKLQKQVDYMEAHSECIMCVCKANWEWGDEIIQKGCNYSIECDLSADEIISHGGLYIATASTLYRTHIIPKGEERPLWWRMADIGDYPLHIYAALYGKMHFLPEAMCVYRFQHSGSWTFNQGRNKDIKHAKCEVAWLEVLDKETKGKYSNAIYSHLYRYYNLLFCEKEISSLEYYRKVCRTGVLSRKKFLKQAIQRIFNHTYKIYCRLKYGK